MHQLKARLWFPLIALFALVVGIIACDSSLHSPTLYVMDVDNSELRSINNFNTYSNEPPQWSPDSKSIAYVTYSNSHTYVYSIDVATGDSIELGKSRSGLFQPRLDADNPAWLADGRLSYILRESKGDSITNE